MKDCILDDMLAFANLPDPPRTRAQLSTGVAANAEHEHLLTKLVYFNHARGPEGFPHEFRTDFTRVWGYMFGKHLFSEDNYIDYLKTSKAHRALLTRKGVVKVPNQDVAIFLEDIYEKNLPLVKQNLERKQNQSNIAKKQGRRRRSPTTTGTSQVRASGCPIMLPHSLDQILHQMLHLERRHPAQGNLKLEGVLHGVTIVTTMACSVNSLGTVVSGRRSLGSLAPINRFSNAACGEHQKWLGKLPCLMCCDDWVFRLDLL